jgi:hypothetical protein
MTMMCAPNYDDNANFRRVEAYMLASESRRDCKIYYTRCRYPPWEASQHILIWQYIHIYSAEDACYVMVQACRIETSPVRVFCRNITSAFSILVVWKIKKFMLKLHVAGNVLVSVCEVCYQRRVSYLLVFYVCRSHTNKFARLQDPVLTFSRLSKTREHATDRTLCYRVFPMLDRSKAGEIKQSKQTQPNMI